MGNTITPDTPLMKRPFTIRVVAQEEDPAPNIAGPPPLHYQCIHCPKTFPKKVQLILHSRSHKKEKSSISNKFLFFDENLPLVVMPFRLSDFNSRKLEQFGL
ncbi:uncharacterized protein [Drosophila pseudoobscura]|uniref:C2H2-type domain-containing protein n=1 Tax=Drosophila pseudoobscura pseudoobscura TaxID=46245 RepID=A0A6I8VRE5_DROPS|nr:uncharacterized protein LOC117183548 [Drosophila pseudoobscura]